MNKIAISGVSGFLGSRIAGLFQQKGWVVVPLLRSDFSESGGSSLTSRLEGCRIVLHLAGAPVNRRWSHAYKERLRSSRIRSTRVLVQAMEVLSVKPQLFLCASAVGIYPLGEKAFDEGAVPLPAMQEEQLSDDAPVSFLQQLCRDWEYEASLCPSSVRLVTLRFGVVLGTGGGAFESMRTPLRFGLSIQVGASAEPFSWIYLADLLAAVGWIADHESIRGPVNLVAPHQGAQGEFAHALSAAFGCLGVVKLPSWVLRLRYGSAVSVLTRGRRVVPAVLSDSGFRFVCSDPPSVALMLAKEVKEPK